MRKAAVTAVQSRKGLFFSGSIGLILAFALATRALSTGSYWQYSGTLLILILSIRLLARAVYGNGKRR